MNLKKRYIAAAVSAILLAPASMSAQYFDQKALESQINTAVTLFSEIDKYCEQAYRKIQALSAAQRNTSGTTKCEAKWGDQKYTVYFATADDMRKAETEFNSAIDGFKRSFKNLVSKCRPGNYDATDILKTFDTQVPKLMIKNLAPFRKQPQAPNQYANQLDDDNVVYVAGPDPMTDGYTGDSYLLAIDTDKDIYAQRFDAVGEGGNKSDKVRTLFPDVKPVPTDQDHFRGVGGSVNQNVIDNTSLALANLKGEIDTEWRLDPNTVIDPYKHQASSSDLVMSQADMDRMDKNFEEYQQKVRETPYEAPGWLDEKIDDAKEYYAENIEWKLENLKYDFEEKHALAGRVVDVTCEAAKEAWDITVGVAMTLIGRRYPIIGAVNDIKGHIDDARTVNNLSEKAIKAAVEGDQKQVDDVWRDYEKFAKKKAVGATMKIGQ